MGYWRAPVVPVVFSLFFKLSHFLPSFVGSLIKHYWCFSLFSFISSCVFFPPYIFTPHKYIHLVVCAASKPSNFVRFVSLFVFHPFIHQSFLFPSVLQQVSSAGHHEHTQVPDEEDAATDDKGERLQGRAGERAGLQGDAHRPERYHSIP